METKSPQGYISDFWHSWRHQRRPQKPTFGLFFAPLSMGPKERMGVNKTWVPRSLGGGCLGLLSGASRSRWELTHRVTAAGSN